MSNSKDIIILQKKRIKRKNILVLVSLFILLCITFFVSMNSGYINLTPMDTIRTLLGGGDDRENLILFDLRLPRIIIAMLIGAGLSVSGCIIQAITKNPLSDPGLLGINAGAGFMVILYILIFNATSSGSVFYLPVLALIGGGVTAIIVYLLSKNKNKSISPIRLVLTGVAMQAGISALTILLVVKMDETQYDFLVSWQSGSIWGASWKFVLALLPWIIILLPYIISKSKTLDIINLGEETACNLGLSVHVERKKLLAVSVALAASCVAVSGSISFVGLVAPHLSRRIIGSRHGILLPTSALIGALLVSLADMISRVILQPSEMPTGIIVSVIGAPYFIYLLAKLKK